MLWFNFFLGLNFIFLCSKLIIIHYHTPKQRKIKFKTRKKLNHNVDLIVTGEKIECAIALLGDALMVHALIR